MERLADDLVGDVRTVEIVRVGAASIRGVVIFPRPYAPSSISSVQEGTLTSRRHHEPPDLREHIVALTLRTSALRDVSRDDYGRLAGGPEYGDVVVRILAIRARLPYPRFYPCGISAGSSISRMCGRADLGPVGNHRERRRGTAHDSWPAFQRSDSRTITFISLLSIPSFAKERNTVYQDSDGHADFPDETGQGRATVKCCGSKTAQGSDARDRAQN
jgi:hypothetical protein